MTTEVTTFEKKLNWRDGVAFALIIPIAIFATVAPAIAAVGLAVLLLSLLLWAYRRVVQDKRSLSLATGDEEVPGPSTTVTPTLP